MGRRSKTQDQSLSITADRLAQTVYDNQPPQHRGTCEVYGFNRAPSLEEKYFLLGLYTDLIKNLHVSPRSIHEWRVRGVLVDEIKAAFYKIPEDSRGLYFPWFLMNQHVVALAGKPLSAQEIRNNHDAMVRRAWRGSEWDSPEEIKTAIIRRPDEEIRCYALYMFLLSAYLPPSKLGLWIDFGFASCASEEEEGALCGQYRRLIAMCTFDEFCKAHCDHRLLDLFHSKGLQVNNNAHLRSLLSGDPEVRKRSVWALKKFVLYEPSSDAEFSVIIRLIPDYGFINCRNADECEELQKMYKDFFTVHRGDPFALYEACIKGKLYGFLSNVIPDLSPKYQRFLTRQRYSVLSPSTLYRQTLVFHMESLTIRLGCFRCSARWRPCNILDANAFIQVILLYGVFVLPGPRS